MVGRMRYPVVIFRLKVFLIVNIYVLMDNKKSIEDYSKEECKEWLQSLVLSVSGNMNEYIA